MWIIGQFESLDAMRLDIVTLPDAVNNGSRNPELRGQHSHAPVRVSITGSGLQRGIDDLLLKFRGQDTARTLSPADARYAATPLFSKAPRSARTVGRDRLSCLAID